MNPNQNNYKEKHNQDIRAKELKTKEKEEILKSGKTKDIIFKVGTIRLTVIFSTETIKVRITFFSQSDWRFINFTDLLK